MSRLTNPATFRSPEEHSVTFDSEVLWTRCLTCSAPLLRPSRRYRAACRNHIACFLRFYRNEARDAWRRYRATP